MNASSGSINEISHSDLFYRLLLRSLPDTTVLVFDQDLRYIAVEGPLLQALGIVPDQVIGKTFWQVIAEPMQSTLLALYQTPLNGKALELEIQASKSPHYFRLRGTPVTDDDGRIFAGMIVVQDITARKQAEIALRESELRYRVLMELIPDGICLIDEAGLPLAVNQSICTLFNRTRAEFLTNNIVGNAVQGNDQLTRLVATLDSSGTARSELTGLRADGTPFPIEVSAAKVTAPNGRRQIWNIVRDISDRKQMEKTLRESEARYQLLTETNADIVVQFTRDGEYTYVSPSIAHVLGYSPAEMIGKTSLDFVHPDDKALILKMRTSALENPQSIEPLEFRLRHKDGHYLWMERTGRAIIDTHTGQVAGFISAFRDTTKRHQSEAALYHSEARYRSVIAAMTEGVVLLTGAGAIQTCNPAAERILGLTAEQMIGRTIVDPLWRDHTRRRVTLPC